MPAGVELIVRAPEIAGRGDQLGFVVALKSRRRDSVEEAVGAVAVFARKAAALDLQLGNVLGIHQRGHVHRDAGVDDRDAVQKPVHLMAAAHMQHVVHHVGSGREVGDHGEAVSLVRAGGLGNFLGRDGGPHSG